MHFADIGTFGLDATCKHCDVLTHFTGQNRYRLEEGRFNIVKYVYQHQCQDCGVLQMADFDDETNTSIVLKERCACGGQFRRDKPLFCSSCKENKTDENKSD